MQPSSSCVGCDWVHWPSAESEGRFLTPRASWPCMEPVGSVGWAVASSLRLSPKVTAPFQFRARCGSSWCLEVQLAFAATSPPRLTRRSQQKMLLIRGCPKVSLVGSLVPASTAAARSSKSSVNVEPFNFQLSKQWKQPRRSQKHFLAPLAWTYVKKSGCSPKRSSKSSKYQRPLSPEVHSNDHSDSAYLGRWYTVRRFVLPALLLQMQPGCRMK